MRIRTDSTFNVFDLFVHDKDVDCALVESGLAHALEHILKTRSGDDGWFVYDRSHGLDRFTLRHVDGREWIARMHSVEDVRSSLPGVIVKILDEINGPDGDYRYDSKHLVLEPVAPKSIRGRAR